MTSQALFASEGDHFPCPNRAGELLLPISAAHCGRTGDSLMLNMLTPKRIVLTGAVLATFAFAVGGLAASSHAADAATKPAAPTTQPDQGGPLKFYGVISAIDVQ